MSDYTLPWPQSSVYDRVSIALRNSEVAAITKDGWLRLAGAGDPTAQLDVRDAAVDVRANLRTDKVNGAALIAFQNDAKELQVGLGADDAFRIYDNTGALTPLLIEPAAPTSALYVDSSGNVGFGTSSPGAGIYLYRSAAARVWVEGSTAGMILQSTGGVADERVAQFLVTTGSLFRLRGLTDAFAENVKGITIDLGSGDVGVGTTTPASELDVAGAITLREKTAEPSDPADGRAVLWLTDGTGFGDDGDICAKVNVGGTVKSSVLFDYSAL